MVRLALKMVISSNMLDRLPNVGKYVCRVCFASIALTVCTASLGAQKIPIFKDPEVDSVYIDLLPGNWSLRAFASSPFQSFAVRNKQDQTVRYVPNNLLGVGLGFSYKFIVLDLGINIKSKETLATTRLDLQMSVLFQKRHIDLYLQTYKGLELSNSPSGQRKFREDIRSSALGINYYHIFNDKELSLRSAFAGDQLQRKSSGTLAMGGYFSYYKLQADSSVIDLEDQSYFNDFAYIENNQLFEMGISGGYAYNLILPKNFFIYSSVMPGIGINFGTIDAGFEYEPPIGPVAKVGLRASVGYANKKVYSFLSFISEYFLIDLGHQNQYRYNPAKIKLVFGYRLQSKVDLLEKVIKPFQVE